METMTTPIRTSNPSTTTPAASVGFHPRRVRDPTTGLKQIARTAAKVIGRTISLTKPNAVKTITRKTTIPTKLQDQIPSLRIQPPADAEPPLPIVSGMSPGLVVVVMLASSCAPADMGRPGMPPGDHAGRHPGTHHIKSVKALSGGRPSHLSSPCLEISHRRCDGSAIHRG